MYDGEISFFKYAISPDIKYTETNIGQPVECAYDV